MRFLIALLFPLSVMAMGQKIPGPQTQDPQWVVENLQGQKQEQKEWCAVAAARMMLSFKGKSASQCEIASKVHGQNCCAKLSIRCLQPIRAENALRAYGQIVSVVAPNYASVVKELKAGRPVTIYHKNWAGTSAESGHAVIAYGTYHHAGRDYIVVYDPWDNARKYWSSDYVVGNLAWYSLVVFR